MHTAALPEAGRLGSPGKNRVFARSVLRGEGMRGGGAFVAGGFGLEPEGNPSSAIARARTAPTVPLCASVARLAPVARSPVEQRSAGPTRRSCCVGPKHHLRLPFALRRPATGLPLVRHRRGRTVRCQWQCSDHCVSHCSAAQAGPSGPDPCVPRRFLCYKAPPPALAPRRQPRATRPLLKINDIVLFWVYPIRVLNRH